MNLRRILESVVTRQLLLGLALVVLCIAALYFALSRFLHEDLSSVVKSQQLAIASYVAHDIDHKIVQRRQLLDQLATALPPELLQKPEALRAWLKERFEYQPLFSAGLFVADVRGVAIADFPVLPNRVNTNYADRDYFRAALTGHATVGRPVIGRAAGEPVLPMAAPLRGRDNRIIGVLAGVTALGAPGFLDLMQHSRIGTTTGGFLLVSPQDKLFLASSQPDMVLKPTPPPGVNRLHDLAMGGYRGTGITVNARGIEEVSAMVSVPSTGWFVVARIPTSEAFATVSRTRWFLLKSALLIVAAFALLSLLGLYFAFRSLFSAVAHADRMTRGEIPFEPLPVGRNDEIGHLIAAFNRVLARLKDNQAELARMAHHDPLTGLPNRALLADRLRQSIAQAQRRRSRIGILFMDLDGFKRVNDDHGHEHGDAALRLVAARFSAIVREADTLARVGGDEFVLLLTDLGDNAEDAARTVAAKCIAALDTPLPVAGTDCKLGVSIGIALGDGGSLPDHLLLAADQAMYEAKRTGRGRYVLSDSGKDTASQRGT